MQAGTSRKFAAPFLLLLAILPTAARAGTPRSPMWNCSVHDGQTRLEFTLPTRVVYHFFTLSHPQRLVIDLDSTRLPPQSSDKAPGCGLVESLHWAERKHQVLRYVLNLTRKAPVQLAASPQQSKEPDFHLLAQIGTTRGSAIGNDRTQPAEDGSHRTNQPFLQVNPGKGNIVIAIDPGHGGSDPGTHGPHGLDEKVVTLSIAKMLAKKIDRTPGLTAFLTRVSDHYVGLRQRVLEAQDHHAALFISIHANAYPRVPRVKGGAVYALSEHGASNAEARLLARTENAADPTIGNIKFATHNREVNSALSHMLQRASIANGADLGKDVLRHLSHYEPLYEHHVQYANFEVLRDPLIPSILIETAFLSNPHQARELHELHFREELANAIYLGIREFLEHHDLRPTQVVSAQRPRKTATDHPVQPGHNQKTTPGMTYRVRPGDTLSGVALRLHVSEWRLDVYNHLHSKHLYIGQVLKLPPPSFEYRVRNGDSLSVIAEKAGVSSRALKDYNNLDNNRLEIGQLLTVPPPTI